jgi:hypothetical protein
MEVQWLSRSGPLPRISLVAARSGNRLLSEPTVGTQPYWLEPLAPRPVE